MLYARYQRLESLVENEDAHRRSCTMCSWRYTSRAADPTVSRTPHTAKRTMTSTISRRKNRSTAPHAPRLRRKGIERLRAAYFNRASDLVLRYSVMFDRLLKHLWHARRGGTRKFHLRQIAHVEDLVLTVACIDGDGRAWSDFAEHFERTLSRRGRDESEDLQAMVEVRRFIATLRRDALAGHSALTMYTGVRPLRSWLAEAFAASKLKSRRSAFVLDPADSCCGTPLRFVRTGG